MKQLKEDIKAATDKLGQDVLIHCPYFADGQPRRSIVKERWTFESARYKKDLPVVWLKYAKQQFVRYFEKA